MSRENLGIKIGHYIITDNCRYGLDNESVLKEALNRLTNDVIPSLEGWKQGDGTQFHIIAYVQPARKKGDK